MTLALTVTMLHADELNEAGTLAKPLKLRFVFVAL